MLPAAVRAQSGFIEHREYFGAGFELLRSAGPRFGGDQAHLGGFLSAQIPIFSGSEALVIDIPISFMSARRNDLEAEGWAIGNPYIGVTSFKSGNDAYVSAGIRAPLATAGADRSRALDITRFDAFIQNRLALMGMVHKPWGIDRVEVTASFGTVMGLTTPGGYGTLDILSGIRAAYEGDHLGFAGALNGRTSVFGIGYDFPGSLLRSLTRQMELAVSYRIGAFRPGIHVRASLYEPIPATWGANVRLLAGKRH
jgi:hypothetical protein